MLKTRKDAVSLNVYCMTVQMASGWLLLGFVGWSAEFDAESEPINRRAWEVVLETFRAQP
jgi:hypothetical protein